MIGGKARTWEDTRLWSTLADREDEVSANTRLVISRVLPDVETVLDHGDSMPWNFTLHDSEHSWRVAENMADIAGELLRDISPYDIGLLLMSAYLHDIGMTPPVGKVSSHFTYVISGDCCLLTEEEREALQVFLDDHWDGIAPPLTNGPTTSAHIAQASQIVADYVRYRHNDWGATWIWNHLAALADDLYAGWLEDLVLLCRSHHFGLEQLVQRDFDARFVGASGAVRHLRYCACLLRVADVLDFDPERTPRILFRHRSISGESVIHWHKDQEIGFDIEDGQITMQAQPPNAIIHNAIIRTIEDVERELLLCDRVVTEKPLSWVPGPKALPHRWSLNSHVQQFINPRSERYEYVDGTFRPDPKRVLDLIGGVELYGSKMVTVRELLQNAFDAVREQIARERLGQPDPGAEQTGEELSRTHRVSLSLERSGDDVRLICRDTGSGMSKDLLLSRFLIGGKSVNHSIRDLERQCQAHGFNVGRTARFGIGVLSYFLLARRLQVDTRRSVESGDQDGVAWTFTSEGLDDFGELSKNRVHGKGTVLTLTVSNEALPDGYEKFAEELRDYVERTVRRTPCHFTFEAADTNQDALAYSPGWIERESDVRELVLQGFRPERHASIRSDLLPIHEQEAEAEEESQWEEIQDRAVESLVVLSEEGEFKDGLGSYRFHLCRFKVETDHPSFAYLELSKDSESDPQLGLIGASHAFIPPYRIKTSWNGMEVHIQHGYAVDSSDEQVLGTLLEVDWTSNMAGQLAVDRNTIQLSRTAKLAIKELKHHIRSVQQKLIDESASSPLSFLDSRLLSLEPPVDAPMRWIRSDSPPFRLRPLRGLLRNREAFRRTDESLPLRWRDREVQTVSGLLITSNNRRPSMQVLWNGDLFRPEALAFRRSGIPVPTVIWSLDRLSQRGAYPPDLSVEFPQTWSQVIGFWSSPEIAWNRDHPVIRTLDRDSWAWASSQPSVRDPLEIADEILRSPTRAAAWLAHTAFAGNEKVWNGLKDRDRAFLSAVWEQVEGLPEGDAIKFFMNRPTGEEFRILDRESWTADEDGYRQWLLESTRDLEDHWWLEVVKLTSTVESDRGDQG